MFAVAAAEINERGALPGDQFTAHGSVRQTVGCRCRGATDVESRNFGCDAGSHNLWRLLISLRSSRAIMSVTLNSLEYGPRQSCLSPW